MSNSSPAGGGQTASNLFDDLLLRPPLLPPQPLHDGHDQAVRPMICRMVIASESLKMGLETRFSAVVLWHRYFLAISHANGNPDNAASSNDMAWAAAGCLLLACKAEEEPRRLRDIINVCHMFLMDQHQPQCDKKSQTTDSSMAKSTQPASTSTASADHKVTEPSADKIVLHVSQYSPPLDDQYWESKPIIVRAEQTVLRWLGFDVLVSKPHRAVCILLQEPKLAEILLQRRKVTYDQIMLVAWRRLNDGLFYAKALQNSVMALAAASVDLALAEVATVSSRDDAVPTCPWWLMVEVSGVALGAAKEDLQRATDTSTAPQGPNFMISTKQEG